MTARQLIVPTVCTGATLRDQLVAQYTDAAGAIHTAILKHAAAYPNALDYPTMLQHSRAITQHLLRARSLTAVMDELHQIAEAVGAQPDNRGETSHEQL